MIEDEVIEDVIEDEVIEDVIEDDDDMIEVEVVDVAVGTTPKKTEKPKRKPAEKKAKKSTDDEVEKPEVEKPKRKAVAKKAKKSTDDEVEKPKKSAAKKSASKDETPKVIEAVRPPTIHLKRRGQHYYHEETALVFNDSNSAIGRYDCEDNVIPLTSADIRLCKEKCIPYVVSDDYDYEEDD